MCCHSARSAAASAACRAEEVLPETDPRRSVMPELTRREVDVVAALCKPALCEDAFVAPATARDIAADLVVTEAAVKQHLLRLYQKLRIAEGPNRRVRLANEVVALGLVRPLPVGRGERLAADVTPGGRRQPGAVAAGQDAVAAGQLAVGGSTAAGDRQPCWPNQCASFLPIVPCRRSDG